MSKKHFSWLLVLTLVVAAIILLMPGKTGHQSTLEVRPLIPGPKTWVNDVTHIRIVKAGDQTVATLTRGEKGWVVEEAHSYPADWSKVQALLASLAQAQVIEPKTTNPDYFDRLGLKDVADSSSDAVMVKIGEGESAVNLLVGHAAQGREGQYVRFPKEEQALLIDRTLNVAAEPRDWLRRDIVDIAEDEVVEVTVTQPDGEQVAVRKKSADDQDFTLQALPEGREIQSSYSVNALGGSLSGLQLDDVKPDSSIDFSQATHLSVLTADGIQVDADVADSDGKSWLRLTASAHEPPPGVKEPAKESAKEPAEEPAKEPPKEPAKEQPETSEQPAAAAGEGDIEKPQGISEESAEAVRNKRIESINERVHGWAYAIPQYKAQIMTKRMVDLLKPEEEEEEGS